MRASFALQLQEDLDIIVAKSMELGPFCRARGDALHLVSFFWAKFCQILTHGGHWLIVQGGELGILVPNSLNPVWIDGHGCQIRQESIKSRKSYGPYHMTPTPATVLLRLNRQF